MAAKFRTERRLIDGKMMKRCTGFEGNGCNNWITNDKPAINKCQECRNKYNRKYYKVAREHERMMRKTPDKKTLWNVRNAREFEGCTDQEIHALETCNVNALLRCPDKHRELKKEDHETI